jgi:hypothetical protein
MVRCRTSNSPRLAIGDCDRSAAPRKLLDTRLECLEQILRAFRDIADRDDIHQAADRLASVQEWLRNEAERAAADPIFVDLRLV